MSSFKEKVYKVVSKIPRGETLTYKEVAEKVGSPKAWRAVGTVLGKNVDENVPCHRVIRSDGKTGGYREGRGNKKTLLKKEGAIK